MLIIGMIVICIVLVVFMIYCFVKADTGDELWCLPGVASFLLIFALPIVFGGLHGYTNYYPSNDKDLARITAVTMEQGGITKPHYRIEVEYLTNASGIVETDTFYCYIENENVVRKAQENLYKECWIITGYKGGYETWNDFGTNLLKDVISVEENEDVK